MFQWAQNKRKQNTIKQHLVRHMGGPCEKAQIISHTIKPIEQVNLHLALEDWCRHNQKPAEVLGYASFFSHEDKGLAFLLRDDAQISLAPVEREQLLQAPGEEVDCVKRGIYLLHFENRPVIVLIRHPEMQWEQPRLELMAHERQIAQSALKHVLDEMNRHIVYKGKAVYLERTSQLSQEVSIRFHELAPLPRENIVLPEPVMEVVERNVPGLLKYGDLLRRSGRATRHGLLFHGAPGTGKTLMIRYLAHACPEHSIVLLTGRQMQLIRESCEVARLLAPSLIVLEDVDLVAEDRERNKCSALLHELLDEMDGLGPKAECIFLLTTNRPEILEPALTARPGRIDQAIEFPLPDQDCRRRLFALYGKGLDLAAIDLDRWIDKTTDVSPAFIEELLRKAALMAAERGETAVPLHLQESDLERGLKELVYLGGELTQKLLGYRAFGFKHGEARV
jgi:hypothetical protein